MPPRKPNDLSHGIGGKYFHEMCTRGISEKAVRARGTPSGKVAQEMDSKKVRFTSMKKAKGRRQGQKTD